MKSHPQTYFSKEDRTKGEGGDGLEGGVGTDDRGVHKLVGPSLKHSLHPVTIHTINK